MTAPAITILLADERVVAVDKPVGLATIPERDLSLPSLHKRLEAERGERLSIVHRVDKEVSGLVVFARTADAHRALSMAFEARRVDKSYLALVLGRPSGEAGTINLPIREFGSGRMGVAPSGKPSRTTWRRLAGAGPTLVAASPLTGRRHQLRVHFYAAGHPIAGDPRYGDRGQGAAAHGGDRPPDPAWPRLMLHAWTLAVDVLGWPPLRLTAPPDAAFLAVCAAAGAALPEEPAPPAPGE